MALTATTLNGAVAFDATKIKLTSATGIAKGDLILVDGEYMTAADISLTPTIEVTRGQQGTAGLAHNTLAPVVYGPAADFVFKNPPVILSIGVNDSNYTAPTVDAIVYLQKATALAVTLNGPAKDQQNTVVFLSGTAAAHAITYTAGFYGDTTSSDVATYAAKAGASMTIVARAGTWGVRALANVTLG